ncbi:MAG TPA: helix-turn-helix transcriptional regulator [Nevskiaceae bacterium]|nr:helix-turn-helix transcriptional regulator [Nevskiaceae bacterium]
MKHQTAVARLAALAQGSRLAVFRLLVKKGHQGLCVGDIQSALKLSPATLSFHLKGLLHAGLLTARQQSRHIYYLPDFDAMNELLGYLTDNCCNGEPCAVNCNPQGRRTRKPS